MQWIKCIDQMPEPTTGYAKQIVTRWTFDKIEGENNIQLRVTTANQLLDLAKNVIDLRKIEWLDESSPRLQEAAEWVRVDGVDIKENARLFAESKMQEGWDRQDKWQIVEFYIHMVNFLCGYASSLPSQTKQ